MPPPPSSIVASTQAPPGDILRVLAIIGAVVGGLYLTRDIALPIVMAIMLAFVLSPVVNMLRRLKLPRAPAVMLAVLFTLGVLVALSITITSQVAQLAADLPRYEATIQTKADTVRDQFLGRISRLAESVGRQIERATEPEPAKPDAGDGSRQRPPPLPVEVRPPELSPLQVAQRFILPALYPLAMFAITFVVLIFILLQREDLRDRFISLFGSRDLHRTTAAMDDAAARLSRFFLTQLVLSGTYGVITAAALWLIGVPSPILWGVLATLMRFVPYIGTVIAAAFPMALALAVDPGWTTLALTAGYFAVGESAMGYIVEPLVYGQSTGLSPFAVILSAIFWSWLWGPVGLILAMPLTLCLVVLGRHVDRFEFIDVLLGDKPPLEPPQNFYHRMLAGDPDEALEQAEHFIKEHSLSAYYDEVALKGLMLAARDARRGVLTSEKLEAIRNGVQSLAQDLASVADAPPASKESEAERAETSDPDAQAETVASGAQDAATLPEDWRAEGAVLCIAGRGPLDEAASMLLAEVLSRHGLGARVLSYESLSRTKLRDLDVSNARIACLSYLEISGSPAHMRYLLRRLRNALPPMPFVVGLWPESDTILRDEPMRQAAGADHYIVTLREALAACLKAARAGAGADDKATAQQAPPRERRDPVAMSGQ